MMRQFWGKETGFTGGAFEREVSALGREKCWVFWRGECFRLEAIPDIRICVQLFSHPEDSNKEIGKSGKGKG